MGADEIVMLVGLGVAVLIVGAWLWTAFRMRGQRGPEQENPAGVDPTLYPWPRGNGGRW